MDKSSKYLTAEECFFLLNNEIGLNATGQLRKGGSVDKSTPLVANYPACEMQRPAGENYVTGKHYSPLTNEEYSFVLNSNGINYLQRISDDKGCEVVYHGCLSLSGEPRHSIENWRAYLKVDKTCKNASGKQLIWVNGKDDIGQMDVDASIATDFFTTPFFQRCADPCALIKMCVPDPCDCLKAEFMPLDPAQASLTNNIANAGFKFIFQWEYYDGRKSIWSDPSTLYYEDIKGCFDNSSGSSRCIKLRIPIGNPLVDKIHIAYSKGDLSESGQQIWYEAEVVEKYKAYNSTQQFWYERQLAELLNYSDDDCSFDYIFCNDKLCEVLDITSVNDVFIPIPREPQGLVQIKDSLGVYNYKKGNCPVDKVEVQKFDVGFTCDQNACATELATVTVRAIIHNTTHNKNQFVYRVNGGGTNDPDDPTDPAMFGGLNPTLNGGFEIGSGYSQLFSGTTRNFIAYVEGTDYWGVMDQYKALAFFTAPLEHWPVIADMTDVNVRNRWRRSANHGEFFYQEVKIKVPKGTRGFLRLTSHEAVSGDGSNQDTSTFVLGILNEIAQYKGDTSLDGLYDATKQEIYFDACNGDVDIHQAFIIDDNAVDSGLVHKASAYNGYVKDKNGLPVEGALVGLDVLSHFEVSCITDHNGFYHFYLNPGTSDDIDIKVNAEINCDAFATVVNVAGGSDPGSNIRHDLLIDNDTYKNDFFANVKTKVQDCNGNGIGGIRVAISGSKYRVTDAFGVATFQIRNYSTRNRVVRAVVMNNNGCFDIDCAGSCSPCMPSDIGNTTLCYLGKPIITLDPATINRDSVSLNKVGLKGGGRYGYGFYVRGNCGRISAVNEIKYLDIPKTQDKNKLGFCSFWFKGNDINLPLWGNCLNIVRTENINPFELQWVIDKIERTDDGKIKLTIQSLNDYNTKYNDKTNTVYQWLKDDRVEFVKNGDGTILSTAQYGLLNYLTISPFNDEVVSGNTTDANFFNQLLIEDDGRLSAITEGAVIELQRAKQCAVQPVYFSICASIPIINGKLAVDSGTFKTFDTYLVTRSIGVLPPMEFEHHSPSDFWGTRLTDTGRAYFVNKYEDEKRFGRNISLNASGQFNFFGDIEKTIDCPEHGDIVSANILDDKIMIVISEHNNSLHEVGNDLLQVGGDGVVRAVAADQLISNPQPKIIGQFGCQYDSIGSIFYGDGFVSFVDVNNHTHIIHNYNSAKPSDQDMAQSYFNRRCQEIQTFNKGVTDPFNKFRFVVGYNRHTKVLQQTIKALRHGGIFNDTKPFLKPNDTILYHPQSGQYRGFASYTPEAYGMVNIFDGNGCAFLSYLNSLPYIHPVIPKKWNEFYGVAVDRVIGISVNKYPEKIKIPLSIEVQDETMWFVADVTTEVPGFRSEIPAIRWEKDQNKWNADFLCNINGRGGLYGNQRNYAGDQARGYAIDVTFVRDNTNALKYGTIDDAKRVKYDELDNILFKFMASEQSGFTENI